MSLAETYPASVVCTVLDYPRSTLYHERSNRDHEQLGQAVQEVAGRWPTYGYRRVTAELRRDGWTINRKRVLRVMRELGLSRHRTVRKRRTTDSDHPFPRYPNLVKDLQVIRPDQVWVSDITYIRLARGFVYLAVILDVFTRCVRGWNLDTNLAQELTLVALRRALAHGAPELHHSDQGVQYAAGSYVAALEAANVRISMAHVGRAWENGYAERFMRTLKEEEVDLSYYESFHDAHAQIKRFVEDVYMRKRVHSALGYLTPVEFEQHWQAENSASVSP